MKHSSEIMSDYDQAKLLLDKAMKLLNGECDKTLVKLRKFAQRYMDEFLQQESTLSDDEFEAKSCAGDWKVEKIAIYWSDPDKECLYREAAYDSHSGLKYCDPGTGEETDF